jgi:hypothetical protein
VTPSKSSANKQTCPDVTSSNCIVWNGPDIPCISICQGDTISEVVYKAGLVICELKDSINLEDTDLKCLVESCLTCPDPVKTLKNVIQLLINKVCTLEEAIENIDGGTTTDSEVFNVNLRCLAVIDGSGNVLNDDNNDEIIQSIIDQVCDNKTDIELLQNQVEDIDTRLTDLEDAPAPTLEIPDVNGSCYGTNASITDVVEDMAIDVCDYKEALGTVTQITQAISQQCTNLQVTYGGTTGFTATPTTLSQGVRNLWIVLCDVLNRVTSIEDTCCAPTCEAVKVGFQTVFDTNVVKLQFTSGAGTSIPFGFTDCGSEVTISDSDGNTVTMPLQIANNYTSPDIDLSVFSAGELLTFDVLVKMCSEGLTCEKCVSKVVRYSQEECCTITNTGTATVTIMYETELNGG